MILVYEKIPARTMRKEAKEGILQIAKWFAINPKKKTCMAQLFYGRMLKIKPDTIAEQVNELVEQLIQEDKAKRKPKAKRK